MAGGKHGERLEEIRLIDEGRAASYSLRELLHQPTLAATVDDLLSALEAAEADARQAREERDAWAAAVKEWDDAYPLEVFPWGGEPELKAAMALVNAEDRNQSARLYAEWGRHISRCITKRVVDQFVEGRA